jgi:thiamine kinase-like enzyme
MDFKNKAIHLFVNHTKYRKQDIVKIKPIHNGYTNISFKFTTSDKQNYQIRISNTKNVDRANEKHILDLVKFPYFIYFDIKTGNAIKKWIDGKHPNIFTEQFLKQLLIEINHIHQIKIIKPILKHDYFDCFKKAKLPEMHKNKYLQLINKYKNLSLMLCHNDLNAENVLIDKKQRLIFIDYEWGRLNNKY